MGSGKMAGLTWSYGRIYLTLFSFSSHWVFRKGRDSRMGMGWETGGLERLCMNGWVARWMFVMLPSRSVGYRIGTCGRGIYLPTHGLEDTCQVFSVCVVRLYLIAWFYYFHSILNAITSLQQTTLLYPVHFEFDGDALPPFHMHSMLKSWRRQLPCTFFLGCEHKQKIKRKHDLIFTCRLMATFSQGRQEPSKGSNIHMLRIHEAEFILQ